MFLSSSSLNPGTSTMKTCPPSVPNSNSSPEEWANTAVTLVTLGGALRRRWGGTWALLVEWWAAAFKKHGYVPIYRICKTGISMQCLEYGLVMAFWPNNWAPPGTRSEFKTIKINNNQNCFGHVVDNFLWSLDIDTFWVITKVPGSFGLQNLNLELEFWLNCRSKFKILKNKYPQLKRVNGKRKCLWVPVYFTQVVLWAWSVLSPEALTVPCGLLKSTCVDCCHPAKSPVQPKCKPQFSQYTPRKITWKMLRGG